MTSNKLPDVVQGETTLTINRTKHIVPVHLGVIMDGNGRWAQARGMPRTAGHREGVKAARRIVEASGEMGIRFLTLFTFSTENWKRPPAEVSYLMRLAEVYALREIPELQRNGVRLQMMGRREGLPTSLLRSLDEVTRETQKNTRLIVNLALNYGGRAEIVDATKKLITAHQLGKLRVKPINTGVRFRCSR